MNITIGEIINVILPFSNLVESSTCNDVPFIRAFLTGKGNVTKAFMYVSQVDDNKYAVCDSEDDVYGKRYLPTGSISKPFVQEKRLIHEMFHNLDDADNTAIISNITLEEFKDYFFKRLNYYNIIKYKLESGNTKFSEMDFTSNKIKKIIDKGFILCESQGDTINDLLRIVNNEGKLFPMPSLKQKEVNCIYAKLRSIGLISTINPNGIIKIDYERE